MMRNYVKLILLFAFAFSFTISDEFCARRLVGGKWITQGDCGNKISTEATIMKELKASVPCRQRKSPRNGVMTGTKTQYMPGDVISFKCNVGYRLKGESEDTCQPRGIWANNKTPTCVLITCKERLAPTSGSIEGINTPYLPGNRIKFACNKLYKLEGADADTCQKSGLWKVNATPKCVQITCSQRNAPANGTIARKLRYLPGHNVTFACDRLYRMEGAASDTCQEDGSWNVGTTPRCVQITCPPRSPPTNGGIAVTAAPYLPGSRIKFTCKLHYRMVGNPLDICGNDGSWNIKTTPKCVQIICPRPRPPADGGISTTGPYVPGRSIKFICNPKHRMVGNARDTCGNDGSWRINAAPKCVRITCPKPKIPTNGGITRTSSRYLPGHTIVFTCNPKYRMEGTAMDTCQESGTWTNAISPKCFPITCPQRKGPPGGGISGQASQYVPGDVITFTCGNFSVISTGAKTDICQYDGSWRYNATPNCTVTSFLCAASDGLYYRKRCYTIPSRVPTQSRLSRREASIECSKTGSSLVTIYNQAQQKAVSDFIVTKLPPRTLVYDVDVWTAMLYYIGYDIIVYGPEHRDERDIISWRTGYPISLSKGIFLLLKVSSASSNPSPGIWNYRNTNAANAILCEK